MMSVYVENTHIINAVSWAKEHAFLDKEKITRGHLPDGRIMLQDVKCLETRKYRRGTIQLDQKEDHADGV